MASEQYREIVGIITHKGNINGLLASFIVQNYCEKNNEIGSTDNFDYCHIQGLKSYQKYQDLKDACGELKFTEMDKKLSKLVEEHSDEIDRKRMEKIKKEMFDDF